MTQPCNTDDSDPQLTYLIKLTARWITAFGGFRPDELGDCESDLWVHYLSKKHLYDSSRGAISTFRKALFERHAISIVRHRRAKMRDPFSEEFSLNGVISDNTDIATSIHETIASPDADAFRLDDLDDDLVTLFERSMGVDRKVLAGKHAGQTHKQIQNDLCLSRRQFDAAWRRICSTAKDLKLDEYLADKRAASTRNRVHEL